MSMTLFPVIDPVATGANIRRLRRERGLTVRDLQAYFGFEEPQAIYKWQRGRSLPSVDNLYALSALLGVPMNEILVPSHINIKEQQAPACCSVFYVLRLRPAGRAGHGKAVESLRPLSAKSPPAAPRRGGWAGDPATFFKS